VTGRNWSVIVSLSVGASAVPAVGQESAAAGPWFSEEAGRRGIVFLHDSGHREAFRMPECIAGGCALVDVDGDGDLDAYLVQSGSLEPGEPALPNRLFLNDGSGAFRDATEGSGAGDTGYGIGVAAGDYDNDADLDLYVTNLRRNTRLRNDGQGRFEDVTDHAGVGDESWSASAAFFDYDRDGHLDLYVTNYVQWTLATDRRCFSQRGDPDYCSPKTYDAPSRDTLYRNQGDGTFLDVSERVGLHRAFGNGLGVVCADFDHDGWIDVFVANDGTPDQLWRNLGGERFEDVAMIAGCAIDTNGRPKAGMGTDVVDIDFDLDPDLLVVNLAGETDSLYRNEGDFFIDDTVMVGLGAVSRPFTRFGVAFVDFNHDGLLDLFEANGRVSQQPVRYADDIYAEPNLLLRGGADRRFHEVLPRGGTAEPLIASSRGAAFGDVDGDLDIDVLICNKDGPAHLLINDAPKRGLAMLLRVLDEHGRDAFNAVVEIQAGGRTIRREIRSAYSYCAASDPREHVVVPTASDLEATRSEGATVTVHWPGGAAEVFSPIPTDGSATLVRGNGRPPG